MHDLAPGGAAATLPSGRGGARATRRSRRAPPGTLLSRVAMSRPLLGGVGRHQVEDAADVLDGGGDDVQRHPVQARGVDLHRQAQPLRMAARVTAVDVVDRGQPRRARRACRRRSGGEWPRGRPGRSRRVLVVAGDAHVGRGGRVELDGGVQEGVGDPVDVGAGRAAWRRQWWRSPAQRTRAPAYGDGLRAAVRSPGRRPVSGGSADARQPAGPADTGAAPAGRGRPSADTGAARRGVAAGAGAGRGEHGDDGAASSSGVGSPRDQAQRRRVGHRGSGGRSVGVAHSGMFPCFLAGRVARLVAQRPQALDDCSRVSDGAITAST